MRREARIAKDGIEYVPDNGDTIRLVLAEVGGVAFKYQPAC